MISIKKISLILFLGALVLTSYSQSWDQIHHGFGSDWEDGDGYGNVVAIYDDFAVVGAPFEDEDENGLVELSNAGSAYILKKVNGNWIEHQKIVASDRESFDFFGYSVSIYGNFIAIGARQEDSDSNGLNVLTNSGSVYIFKKDVNDNWSQFQKITASDRIAEDGFGVDVDVYDSIMVVGSWKQDFDEQSQNLKSNTGAAYIYELKSNGMWQEVQKLVASDRNMGDEFGCSVSIDFDKLVVGAWQHDKNDLGMDSISNSGAVYFYSKDSLGVWNEINKVVASERYKNDWYGRFVSISGDYAIVGAYQEDQDENELDTLTASGSAYILKFSNNQWSQYQKIVASDREELDYFGSSVSIYNNYAVVGAIWEDSGLVEANNSGAAYLFELDSNDFWKEIKKITPSIRKESSNFGYVDISSNSIIIGANKEYNVDSLGNEISDVGAVYIYEKEDVTPPVPPINSVKTIGGSLIKVSPNPFEGVFLIESFDVVINDIRMYDLLGKEIDVNKEIISNEIMVKAQNLKKGTYIVECRNKLGEIIVRQKVVKY